jgi:hypothetical protein
MLFGDGENLTVYDYVMSTQEIAERVYADLTEKSPATEAEIHEEVSAGYFPGYPNYEFNTPSRQLEKEFGDRFPKLELWETETYKDNSEAMELANRINAMRRAESDDYRKRSDDAAKKYADESVLPKLKGKTVYCFSYADDGGETVMEHGGIFDNLTHFVISHH